MKNKLTIIAVVIQGLVVALLLGVYLRNNQFLQNARIESSITSANLVFSRNELNNSELLKELLPVDSEIVPASLQKTNAEMYDEMSVEELENALMEGRLPMEYSALYTYSANRLSVSRGALYFNGHKETYYSEKVLPGNSLNIPGRHVAEDGTIRDGDGFICVAANPEYMPRHTILITSLGPAKVYDTGCDYGTIDIYVSW
jgi:hypothetical protein